MVVANALGKFPHEVATAMTCEEVIYFLAFLELQHEANRQ